MKRLLILIALLTVPCAAQYNGTNLSTDGNIQAYWYFENGWTDGTGHGNNYSTCSGTPPTFNSTAGQLKEGSFSSKYVASSSERCDVPVANVSASFPGKSSGSQSFSFGLWWQPEVSAAAQGIMAAGTGTPAFGIEYVAGGTNSLRFYAHLDTSLHYILPNAGSFSSGTWYHLVGVYDAGTKVFNSYVNGVKQTASYTASPGSLGAIAGGVYLGYDTDTAVYTTGNIDEQWVFNRALTAGEVASIYNCLLAGSGCSGAGTPSCSAAGLVYTCSSSPSTEQCWTVNGSTPSTDGLGGCANGTLYATNITVSGSGTLKVIGGGQAYVDSSAASYAYTSAAAVKHRVLSN